MHISIFASVGCQNLGDELIIKNEIKMLEKEYGEDTLFTVFTYDLKNPFFNQYNITYKEYFPIGIKQKKNLWKNIKNFFSFISIVKKSDLIVLGGGGIIFDNEVQQTNTPLDLWIKRVKVFNFFNKKYIYFRGGLNIKDETNYDKVKEIFKRASFIEVRDKYSQNLLTNLGIKSFIKKDPVFYDRGYLVTNKSIIGVVSSQKFNINYVKKYDLKGKRVGLAIRSGYFVPQSKISPRMEQGIIKEIINYLVSEGVQVVLMPHSFHKTDILANDYEFLKNFADGNKSIKLIKDMEEVYKAYTKREIDFCFAMRLHSIILSHVYEIPFVGISYSTKTDEILDELMK